MKEEETSILETAVPLLLQWFSGNSRDLPWRKNRDPYRILVSEFMLQQTRVETVKPYFERFLTEFPTLESLAAASESRLLKLWEGLGYYQRVRSLQKAAQIVCSDFGGTIPADYAALRTLPGVGDYTAGSVASIAYGIPVPAVDGNVLRVLSRLLNRWDDISSARTKNELRQITAEILPEETPGTFNQAIMELGALVCLPNSAVKCESCPLAVCCKAHKAGCAESLPVKAQKKPRKIEPRTLLVCLTENGVLLTRRPTKGLLAGLWEYPNLPGFLFPKDVRRIVETEWLQATGSYRLLQLPPARHIFSHLEWHFHAYLLYCAPFAAPPSFMWTPLEELRKDFALPSAFQRYTVHLSRWEQEIGLAGKEREK